MSWRAAIVALAFLTSIGAAVAHDLWIIPSEFHLGAGRAISVELRVGEKFPASMNAPKLEGVTRFALVTADGETPIEGARSAGKVARARVRVATPGTSAIVLEGNPRHIVLKPAEFKDYLLHEGLAHIHEQRLKAGEADKEGRERYSRHAKALLRAGRGPGVPTQALGLKLELVPSADPYDLAPGRPLTVTALFDGKPLPDLELRSYTSNNVVHRTRTAADGTATLTFGTPGPWAVAYIHMERCPDCADADWRSYFGTTTFAIGAAAKK